MRAFALFKGNRNSKWFELRAPVLKYNHIQHRTRHINLYENLHFIQYHMLCVCVYVWLLGMCERDATNGKLIGKN